MSKALECDAIVAKEAIPYATEEELKFPALTCQIPSSSLTCLVGPHRAQLRAYLQMLTGVSMPKHGKVVVLGQDVAMLDQLAWREFRSQIGYLSGSAPLLSAQHALMNVMLPLLYHQNLPYREAADKARVMLKQLDCQFEPTTSPALLNGFQRTQLALCRALIVNPELLVLDVPFNDLGAKERHRMSELLNKCKYNRTVCMIGGLQYPRFLEQNAQQIIFISEHKVMSFNGWTSFKQTEDKHVQAFLSVF